MRASCDQRSRSHHVTGSSWCTWPHFLGSKQAIPIGRIKTKANQSWLATLIGTTEARAPDADIRSYIIPGTRLPKQHISRPFQPFERHAGINNRQDPILHHPFLVLAPVLTLSISSQYRD